MILMATTTLHFLQGTDPADGYEDEAVVWSDRAAVPGHVDFSKTTRTVGSGSVQYDSTTRFQSDMPGVPVDVHWRVRDETTGTTYQIVDLDYATMLDCLTGTLEVITGIA